MKSERTRCSILSAWIYEVYRERIHIPFIITVWAIIAIKNFSIDLLKIEYHFPQDMDINGYYTIFHKFLFFLHIYYLMDYFFCIDK